ncbi:MAG: hypothetical protein FJ387_04975 [Verrucomicrobia bacterium]|nr:hypothetical protein [Verrucomicrobiota bacterium]
MNRDTAFQALTQTQQELQALIPADTPAMGKRHLGYVLEEHLGIAQRYLRAIYEAGCEIAPGFQPCPEHRGHPKYAFWLEGIQRHLAICRASLSPSPAPE